VIGEGGTKTYTGLRCMTVTEDERTLVTGGADGMVVRWDVADGGLSEESRLGEPLAVSPPYAGSSGGKQRPTALRALDCKPESDTMVIGTGVSGRPPHVIVHPFVHP
jgi:hypothetical protein